MLDNLLSVYRWISIDRITDLQPLRETGQVPSTNSFDFSLVVSVVEVRFIEPINDNNSSPIVNKANKIASWSRKTKIVPFHNTDSDMVIEAVAEIVQRFLSGKTMCRNIESW